MLNQSARQRAFTLLELLAVITIIGIIAAMAVSRVSVQALNAKKKCCLQYKGDLNAAIEGFYFERGAYPVDLADLEGQFYTEAIPNCPVNNSAYTIDPVTHRIQGHDH